MLWRLGGLPCPSRKRHCRTAPPGTAMYTRRFAGLLVSRGDAWFCGAAPAHVQFPVPRLGSGLLQGPARAQRLPRGPEGPASLPYGNPQRQPHSRGLIRTPSALPLPTAQRRPTIPPAVPVFVSSFDALGKVRAVHASAATAPRDGRCEPVGRDRGGAFPPYQVGLGRLLRGPARANFCMNRSPKGTRDGVASLAKTPGKSDGSRRRHFSAADTPGQPWL